MASQCKNLQSPISEEEQPTENPPLERILDPKEHSKKRPAEYKTSNPQTSIITPINADELQTTKLKRPEARSKRKQPTQEKRTESLQRYDSTDSILSRPVSETLECVKSLFDNDNNHCV
ncbi:hypothetical protein Zmor_018327 [Zophobas morio]|uniref:Uncharacterized protein n=1 Tax=Zophobas morio TaxID=2755281 RepID=A0AA38IB79_9CUCU|nr:hypothetical protein Zmor_018327 [Zophobas morio]